ncbi:hypothetical protein [uncultured Lutibacter sp.]|uniref:hypothetical protein n=1 Tax=uncultured Lutibacter sp. TaxID=437739 RepID=UPI002619A006|nr:hypothetical protein [uncultured Lutibacter sp.]
MQNKLNIFLIISLAIILWLYFAKSEVVKEVTKIEIKYDTITKIVDNTKPNKIEKVFIKVPEVIIQNDTITKVIYKNKEVQKYHYKDTLQNGVLESTILADNIYKRDIKLTTFNKETTTKTVKTIVKSELYFGTIFTISPTKQLENTSVNAFYTHKNKWLITGGVGYNFYENNPNISIGVGFKF